MDVPFLLAPMAELSHRALRELIEEFGGCDEYFAEMISAGALLAGGPFESWYVDSGPRPEKLVFQLVGADLGQIVRAAALLDQLECAGIDINMGCSAPLIRKTGAGVAWMASIDRAGELAGRVRQAVKRRLSVKLRLGFKDDFDYLAGFCRRLEAEGVELITLHPRTAGEKFKRLARWDNVAALRRELHIPVAGNGDIDTAADLIRRAAGGCDAVMAGRAAVRRPWIFAEARWAQVSPLAVSDPIPVPQDSFQKIRLEETGLRFLELLTRYQPPAFHLSRARRFFAYFCDNLKWGNYLKNLLNREENVSGIERVWRGYFAVHEPH
ncbi:MAG: tRNA-dihydrouridine synthase family protein [Treponema sp.]|jgi:tRNA-dihydrouridine synthase|nr:tRNA-dihydrouridine synthase family protein [Treponema sp.]